MLGAGKPVAAVCHAPAVLRDVMGPDQMPLLRGRRATGFANSEEEAVGLSEIVPFRVEDMIRSRGGIYSKAADWQPHVVTEGLLVTGQNPASSIGAAQALLELVRTGSGERLERSSGSRRRASA
jgi:putative intracellular protease/amidase